MDDNDMEVNDVSQLTTVESTASDVSSNRVFGEKHRIHHGLIPFLLHSPRGLAVVITSAAVVFSIMLGIYVCLCIKCLRRRKQEPPTMNPTLSTPSSFTPSPNQVGDASSKSGKLKIPPHKNVITPDKNITFVVPTVPLHVQGLSKSLPQRRLSLSTPMLGATSVLPPILENQFFPQLHFEDAAVGPQIGFCLFYDFANQNLKVRLLAGSKFPADSGLNYTVHVKLYPCRSSKHRTKEIEGPNPIYNQEFNFHVRANVLQTKVLKFRVIGSGTGVMGTKILLGVVSLAMKDIPMVNHGDVTSDFFTDQMWIALDHPLNLGEGIRLDVSLKWTSDPTPGLLILKIREAQGLHEITETEYTSTYVKVTLEEQGKSIKSRKTRLIRWGSLPDYDDTFVVTVPFELLTQVSFVLTLYARGRLGCKTILGKIHIGPIVDPRHSSPQSRSGSTSGNEMWEDMIHQPNIEITRSLKLKP